MKKAPSKGIVDLPSLFDSRRKQLMTHFDLIRKHSTHHGTTGDASESHWIGVLTDFLPKRYAIEKAIVIDSKGHFSDQIDIVIFDRQYSPLVVREHELVYVPVESVYAILEAKQDINKKNLQYAAKKAQSVRNLHRTSVPFQHIGGEDTKPLFRIPSGIVALGSEWNPPLGDPFKTEIGSLANTIDCRLDLGCVLDAGAFSVEYGQGIDTDITVSKPEASLMVFLFDLFAKLRTLGTVPAIDLDMYAAWVAKS